MKIAPILHALDKHDQGGGQLRYRLIHTGQHYDASMSGNFFEQLQIPQPHVNLEVGSGTQAEQTAGIMTAYERVLLAAPCDLCLVVGDVTSTMATAITAQKSGIPVAHIEAGIRSDDWRMPEEINRLLTDAISNWFFTTSESANKNLERIGVDGNRVFFVGNTMIDTLLANMDKLKAPAFWDELGLERGGYFVLTMHRPSNVDSSEHFDEWLQVIAEQARKLPVVFPVHPRTAKLLRENKELPDNIKTVDPQPYWEFNFLVKNAKAILTDSGGITEEATVMGVPCMTLRDTTERPETVEIGTNVLVGTDPGNLSQHMGRVFDGTWKDGAIPEKWDGKTAERIVSIVDTLLCK